MSARTDEFSKRWKVLNENKKLIPEMRANLANREMPTEGALEYLLDSLCMPCHLLLRVNMGRKYFTYSKVLLSSLFFFLCLALVQFRFATVLFISPFTPGGIRVIPEILLPDSAGEFFSNLRISWKIWMGTFEPVLDQLLMDFRSPEGMTYKITGIYYLMANTRFILSKLSARVGDAENIDSSGVSLIFLLPIFRWAYGVAYLFNFKTDVVKQYLEPLILFALAQCLLESGRPEYWVFPGICLFFGSLLVALQAFVRSWGIRRDADNAIRGKFRNEARDSQMDAFDMYSFGNSADAVDLGSETRQPRR